MQINNIQPPAASSSNSTIQKISSGKEVNQAKDNAASLSQISKITSSSQGKRVAMQNIGDGVGALQTADGQLANMEKSLMRMQELLSQSNNGSYSNSDKQALNKEFQQISQTIQEQDQSFNGRNVLSGESLNIQSGPNAGDQVDIKLPEFSFEDLQQLSEDPFSDAAASQEKLQELQSQVSEARSSVGAQENALQSQSDRLQDERIVDEQARSRKEDADYAKLSSELAKEQTQEQVANALFAQASKVEEEQVLSLISR